MDLPYEGFRRLSRSSAMESNTVVLGTQENTPILRIPGATMPGMVGFQVEDPGVGNLASCLIRIERERERTIGVQEFTIGSSGAGFVSLHAILGGGSANITGGTTVSATTINVGHPCTVSAWVDWTPNVSQGMARCPFSMQALIQPGGGNAVNFGAVPSGARWITVFTNQGTANLTCEWQDAVGARIAGYNGWSNGDPQVAMAGSFLEITNSAGAAVDVGVVYT